MKMPKLKYTLVKTNNVRVVNYEIPKCVKLKKGSNKTVFKLNNCYPFSVKKKLLTPLQNPTYEFESSSASSSSFTASPIPNSMGRGEGIGREDPI